MGTSLRNFRLDDEQYYEFEAISEIEGRSGTAQLKEALDEHIIAMRVKHNVKKFRPTKKRLAFLKRLKTELVNNEQ